MSKKKARKLGKKTTATPRPEVEESETVALVPENPNVESDAPATPRRSIEAEEDSVGGDVERADQ